MRPWVASTLGFALAEESTSVAPVVNECPVEHSFGNTCTTLGRVFSRRAQFPGDAGAPRSGPPVRSGDAGQGETRRSGRRRGTARERAVRERRAARRHRVHHRADASTATKLTVTVTDHGPTPMELRRAGQPVPSTEDYGGRGLAARRRGGRRVGQPARPQRPPGVVHAGQADRGATRTARPRRPRRGPTRTPHAGCCTCRSPTTRRCRWWLTELAAPAGRRARRLGRRRCCWTRRRGPRRWPRCGDRTAARGGRDAAAAHPADGRPALGAR